MPPIDQWEAFFEPERVLDALAYCDVRGDTVEFGCGYGTFTIAAAQRGPGSLFAMDIDPLMVSKTLERASRTVLKNIVAEQRDFISCGSGRPDRSVSYVLLFNILHLEDPVSLLRESFRVLCPGGKVGVIHWRCDIETPRGPPAAIRPSPEQCRQWAQRAGLEWSSSPDLSGAPWHWGMTFERPAPAAKSTP